MRDQDLQGGAAMPNAEKLELDVLDRVVGGTGEALKLSNQNVQALEAAVMAQVRSSSELDNASRNVEKVTVEIVQGNNPKQRAKVTTVEADERGRAAIDNIVTSQVNSLNLTDPAKKTQATKLAYATAFTELANSFTASNRSNGTDLVDRLLRSHSADIITGAASMDATGLNAMRTQLKAMAQVGVPGALTVAETIVINGVLPISMFAEMAAQGIPGVMNSLKNIAVWGPPGAVSQISTLAGSGNADAATALGELATNKVPGAMDEIRSLARTGKTAIAPVLETLVGNGKVTIQALGTWAEGTTVSPKPILTVLDRLATRGNTEALDKLTALATSKVAGAVDEIKTMAKGGVTGIGTAIETLATNRTMTVSDVAALLTAGAPGMADVLGRLAVRNVSGALDQIKTFVNAGNLLMAPVVEDLVLKGKMTTQNLAEMANTGGGRVILTVLADLAGDGNAAALGTLKDLAKVNTSGALDKISSLAMSGDAAAVSALVDLAAFPASGALNLIKAATLRGASGVDEVLEKLVDRGTLTVRGVATLVAGNGAEPACTALGRLAQRNVAGALDELKKLARGDTTAATGATAQASLDAIMSFMAGGVRPTQDIRAVDPGRVTASAAKTVEIMVLGGVMTVADLAALTTTAVANTGATTNILNVLRDLAENGKAGALEQLVTLATQTRPVDGALAQLKAMALAGEPAGMGATIGGLVTSGKMPMLDFGDLVRQGAPEMAATLNRMVGQDTPGAKALLLTLARDGVEAVQDIVKAQVATKKVTLADISTLVSQNAPGIAAILGDMASRGEANALDQVKTQAKAGARGMGDVVETLVANGKMSVADVTALLTKTETITKRRFSWGGGSTVTSEQVVSPTVGAAALLYSLGDLATSGNSAALNALKAEVGKGTSGALAAVEHMLDKDSAKSIALAAELVKTGKMPIQTLETHANSGSKAALAALGDLVKSNATGAAAVLDRLLAHEVAGSAVVAASLVQGGFVQIGHLKDLCGAGDSAGAVSALGVLAANARYNGEAIAGLKTVAFSGGGDADDARMTLLKLKAQGVTGAEGVLKEISAAHQADQAAVRNAFDLYFLHNNDKTLTGNVTLDNVESVIDGIAGGVKNLHSGLTPPDMARSMVAALMFAHYENSPAMQRTLAVEYGEDLVEGGLAITPENLTPLQVQRRAVDLTSSVLIAAGIDHAGPIAAGVGLAVQVGYSALLMSDKYGVMSGIAAGLTVADDPTSVSAWTDGAAILTVAALEDAAAVETAPIELTCALVQSEAVNMACRALLGNTNNTAIQAYAQAVQGTIDTTRDLATKVISLGYQARIEEAQNYAIGTYKIGTALLKGDLSGVVTETRALIVAQAHVVADFANQSLDRAHEAVEDNEAKVEDAKAAIHVAVLSNLSQLGVPSGANHIIGPILSEFIDYQASVMSPVGAARAALMFADLAKANVDGAANVVCALAAGDFSGAGDALRSCMDANVTQVREIAMQKVNDLMARAMALGDNEAGRALVSFAAAGIPGAAAAVDEAMRLGNTQIRNAAQTAINTLQTQAVAGSVGAATALAHFAAHDVGNSAVLMSSFVSNAVLPNAKAAAEAAIAELQDLGSQGVLGAREVINTLADSGVVAAKRVESFFQNTMNPTNW